MNDAPKPGGWIRRPPVRALSIWRPWAGLIAARIKPVENRPWSSPYRGELWVHAASKWDGEGCRRFFDHRGIDPELACSWDPDAHPGGIVAVAELAEVCTASANAGEVVCGCGPWAARGQNHLRLEQVIALPAPVPCRGQLGLWTPDQRLLSAVDAQLRERP